MPCLFFKSEGIDADIGSEDDLDNCLNLTSGEKEISDGEGEELVPSAHQDDFDNEMEQMSEGSSDKRLTKRRTPGILLALICELQTKYTFCSFSLSRHPMFLELVPHFQWPK